MFPYPFLSLFHTCVGRQLDWEVVVVDDASPDGTLEVAKELAKVYGEDKIVWVYFSCYRTVLDVKHIQILKPRAGKLGLG